MFDSPGIASGVSNCRYHAGLIWQYRYRRADV